ncbi:hypothetical protein STEG23_016674 [Scotinomys teguina]
MVEISAWFQEAIGFIDSVKNSGGRVLVHCQAGISRSATICLAYLIQSRRVRLDEAFDFVKQRRGVISPNFSFMGQLLQFETQKEPWVTSTSAKLPVVPAPPREDWTTKDVQDRERERGRVQEGVKPLRGLISEETPESSFLVEGDIIRPSPFRLLSVTNNKWPKSPGGIVEIPFLFSSKYDESSRRVIMEAFAEFEHFTCIRFVPYQGHRDFIYIIPMSGCFSGVGRSGGMQVVSLAPTCLQKGRGIVLHELMHVLGFWHEHSRADRDRYIRVNWNEILPGFEINFIKSRSSNMLAPYDYSSVMHYGRFAFSWRGQPTIIPLWTPSAHIGQRWNLSTSDITRVRRLYNCSQSVPDSHRRAKRNNPDNGHLPKLRVEITFNDKILNLRPRVRGPQ